MYRKEWRIISRRPNAILRQLYINGFPTDQFRFSGRSFRMPPIMGASPTTYSMTVGTDDGCYRGTTSSGTWYGNSNSVTCGRPATNSGQKWWAWLRWQNVTLSGTITQSYVRVYIIDDKVGTPELKIYGVDEDNPDAPTNISQYQADPLTNESVDWDNPPIGYTDTPSLNAIFQELVDTYTIENEAVMLQIRDDKGVVAQHTMRFWAYEVEAPEYTAKLTIEYSAVARRIFIVTT